MKIDAIIFDMDGVLINVEESYRQSIRRTVQAYFEECLGLEPFDGNLVTPEEIAALKLSGGFNQDWDVSAALVKYFLAQLPDLGLVAGNSGRPSEDSGTVAAASDWLQGRGHEIDTTVEELAHKKDLMGYARSLREVGKGFKGTWQVLGERNDALLFFPGDIARTNLVQRLFQEFYLGAGLFNALHGEAAYFVNDGGLILREKLIPSRETLHRLASVTKMGIATGRPRGEALYALDTADIRSLYDTIVTMDEVVDAETTAWVQTGSRISLMKPHPFPLLMAARALGSSKARYLYIGDTLDDMRATSRAKRKLSFVSVGCLAVAKDKDAMRKEFEDAGADYVVEHPNELIDLIGA